MLDPNTGAYVPNDSERQLIEALRSGKYFQHTGSLRVGKGDPSFCCLGVACDISGRGMWAEGAKFTSNDGDGRYYAASSNYLTHSVRRWLNWATVEGRTALPDRSLRSGYTLALDRLNDQEFNFDQIADIIQAGLVWHEDEEPWIIHPDPDLT